MFGLTFPIIGTFVLVIVVLTQVYVLHFLSLFISLSRQKELTCSYLVLLDCLISILSIVFKSAALYFNSLSGCAVFYLLIPIYQSFLFMKIHEPTNIKKWSINSTFVSIVLLFLYLISNYTIHDIGPAEIKLYWESSAFKAIIIIFELLPLIFIYLASKYVLFIGIASAHFEAKVMFDLNLLINLVDYDISFKKGNIFLLVFLIVIDLILSFIVYMVYTYKATKHVQSGFFMGIYHTYYLLLNISLGTLVFGDFLMQSIIWNITFIIGIIILILSFLNLMIFSYKLPYNRNEEESLLIQYDSSSKI